MLKSNSFYVLKFCMSIFLFNAWYDIINLTVTPHPDNFLLYFWYVLQSFSRKERVNFCNKTFDWSGWSTADQALMVNFLLFFLYYCLCPPGLSITQNWLIYQIQVYFSRTSIRSIMASSFSFKDQSRPENVMKNVSCSKQLPYVTYVWMSLEGNRCQLLHSDIPGRFLR